jgi:hypothetical protein
MNQGPIVSYNANTVKIYNNTSGLHREFWKQSYDIEFQLQRCKNLQCKL